MASRPEPFDSAFVFELPSVGAPALRPSDGAVAYVVTRSDAETFETSSHLELAPFSGGAARRLTSGPRDGSPRWSPDGALLALLRREDADAPPQLWLLPSDGGEATRLTELAGGVAEYVWAPDGAALYCTSDVDPSRAADGDEGPVRPRTREVHSLYYRGDTIGWRGETRRQVFRVEVPGGSTRQLTRGDFHHRSLAVSPDGTRLAFVSDRSRRRDLRMPWGGELCVMPSTGGRVRRLVREPMASGGVAWSPDGRELAFAGTTEANIWQHYLYLADAQTGACRQLTDDAVEPQTGFFPVIAAPPLAWHRGRIVFAADARGSSGIYSVSRSGELRAERSTREVVGGLDASPDGRRLAFVASTPDRPGEVRTLDVARRRGHALTSSAAAYLEGHAVGRTERFVVRRGGQALDCWLLHPPGFDARRRYPLVLEIHGGPNGYFGTGFNALHQVLAGAGNLVLSVNPRGSTSYGAEFTAAVFEDWGGEDHLDLLAALEAACRRPYVDAERLGVHGYSYGGYMSAWLVGHDDHFRAAAIGAPVTNLLSMYGQTDIAASFGEQQWGGLPHDHLEHYLERSPLSYADRVETPVLLLHGEADIRVPISQSEELFAALKRRGKTVEFVRFPDCSHLFLRVAHPSLRKEYYDRVVEWFARWL
jgi:dipeptidyl aminopeptidase/acylaminoacyl peptidase